MANCGCPGFVAPAPTDGAPIDSRTAGFLAPLGPEPPDDAALCALIQPTLVGITGLAGNLVRRAGQEIPGAQPDRSTTWCSFSVTTTTADVNPSILHDGRAAGGWGQDVHLRSEEMQISVSFYGPTAVATAKRLRAGLGQSQNRAALRAAGIAYVGIDRVTFVPDAQNGQVIRRADLVFTARRMTVERYPVRNIIAVNGGVIADGQSRDGPSVVTSPLSARS